MSFGINQTSLESLPPHERNRVCKQIRQQQIENYVQYTSEEKLSPRKRKPNKRNTAVQFGINHLLQTAIESFDDREVLSLLSQGADVDFTTANNTSLLHKCCMVGNVTAAEILIGRGADVNVRDSDWWTPLHVACYHDYADVVNMLLTNGADITLLDIDGNFAFDHVMPDFETYDIISAHKSNLGLNSSVQSALRRARCDILLTAVQQSLNRGEDINTRFPGGITWLHMASSNGYKGVVKLLLNNNADVNAVDNIGWAPLHVAAKYSQVKAAKMLLKHGADTSKVDHYGRKPVEIAGTEEVQKAILDASQGNRQKKHSHETVDRTQDSDDELEPKESVVSKNIHSTHMSLSKSDKLMESQMRYAAETTSRPNYHGTQDMDEEDEDPMYISAIWKAGDSEEANLPETLDTDDLTTFPDLSQRNIVETLQNRYNNRLIYTYIGDILIAVNPFMELPYYAKTISKQYNDCIHLHSLPPHVYAIAEQARRQLMVSQTSQSCMISGESGAGKTESCKFLVQHLLRVSGSTESGLSSKITQVNPLLEAFGNARTVMNDNSSRFAKFLEVSYTSEGEVVGAELSEYLLEKSRIVHQGRGERNFHIFYWMLSGITPEEASSCLFDKELNFRYLQPDGRDVKHKSQPEDKQKFWDVKNCLDFVGFAKEDLTGLTTTLAAILHLGNVHFIPIMDGLGSDVENYDVLMKVCKLLRVEFEDLRLSLVEESMIARGEELRRPLSVTQAEDSRDALAKSLYSRLFSWLVNGINSTIQPVEPSTSSLSIAILDIFGFENLKNNGFEQICINLANEQLQMFFNEQVFQQERQDCLVEGVPVIDVSFPSNQTAISLFLEKNTGILALLDEESTLMTSTDRTLATKLHQGPGQTYPSVYKTPRDKGTTFTIVHYAGSISYDLEGMLDKNRDTLRSSLSFVMRSSSSLLIKDLFNASMSKTGSLQPSTRQLSLQREMSFRRSLKTAKSPFDFFKKMKNPKLDRPERRREMLTATGTTKKGPSTMAYQFRNSLNIMMSKLQKSHPHFIRCIKPNDTQAPLGFLPDYVKAQLLYTGVLETVKIRKHGYALRITCPEFLKRYHSLDMVINTLKKAMTTPEQACQDILHHYGINQYQKGKTKLFLHQGHVDLLDEKVLEIQVKIIKCQKTIRGFNARQMRRKLSTQHDNEELQIGALLHEVEMKQNQLSDWLEGEMYHDSQTVTTRLQKEVSKSLEALDEILDIYERGGPVEDRSVILDNTLYESTTDAEFQEDIFVPCPTGIDRKDSLHRTDDSGVEEGDDESYQDATSLPGATLALRSLPPPPEEDMDSSRHFPPSPKDMYGGLYATISENGHKADKRHPPSVPQRAPETKLSTFSPRSSSTSSGIYNEPDVYDAGQYSHWQTVSPSSPGSHAPHGTHGHWQPTSPSSPRLKSKLVHGQQPGSPRRQENQPFSYGLNFSAPQQGQGKCNGNFQNGQRARTGSTDSSSSSDNTYARWIHIDQEESELPPYPTDAQPTYQHVQCVPSSPVYNAHTPPTAYGVPTSHHSPGVGRPNPYPPPVPPPNPCQGTPPPHVTSQIQQLKNNAIGSPKQQHKGPGSPKMSSKLHSLKIGPQIPDLNLKMDPSVPPPPNFPAPPPPVSPQARYQAVVQVNTRGRSPSPPPPPPPLDLTHGKAPSAVPPPPPPISTIPNTKTGRTKEKESASPRQNVNIPATQNGGEAQATQLAAEIGNIKLKRVNSPQVAVAPIQTAVEPAGNGQINFRLRPTPGAVDIYKGGRDDTTKDEELPPPPPPPPIEMEPEPEPEPRPVAVVTAQPQEPRKTSPADKGKSKERSPLLYNMDLEIPDDIDINNVPGVIPVTKDTPNWKREMQEKKNREKIEEYVRKILREREEQAKWRDVPEWKRKILMKKSQEEQEAALAADQSKQEVAKTGKKPQVERPNMEDCGVPRGSANITPAAMAMDPAELESMPPWKRELLFKREKVPMTFFNEFNPEDEAEAPPS